MDRLPVLEVAPESPRPRYEEGMNFAAVLQESQGVREKLAPPPVFERPPVDLAEQAWRALYEVPDPEFPISLIDLGLVSRVEADETSGSVTVYLTFTSTACPCMDFIHWDVRERLLEEEGIEHVDIEAVWDPPWTTAAISARGHEILHSCGVAT